MQNEMKFGRNKNRLKLVIKQWGSLTCKRNVQVPIIFNKVFNLNTF